MNEKAITLTVFFISVFLLYQIRFIVRLRKLRKIKGIETGKGHFMEGVGRPVCDCCCFDAIVDFFYNNYLFLRERYREKKFARQSEEIEQKTVERHIREQNEYIAKIEKEKIERKGRVEELRASGYTIVDKNRNKVIETASISEVTNLSWMSVSISLPIDEIIIIIEDEQDFELRDEYIINKKKIKIKEKICPNCENLFESGSEFCPNCGQALK